MQRVDALRSSSCPPPASVPCEESASFNIIQRTNSSSTQSPRALYSIGRSRAGLRRMVAIMDSRLVGSAEPLPSPSLPITLLHLGVSRSRMARPVLRGLSRTLITGPLRKSTWMWIGIGKEGRLPKGEGDDRGVAGASAIPWENVLGWVAECSNFICSFDVRCNR